MHYSEPKPAFSNPGVLVVLSSTPIPSKEAAMHQQPLPCREGGRDRIIQGQLIYLREKYYTSQPELPMLIATFDLYIYVYICIYVYVYINIYIYK